MHYLYLPFAPFYRAKDPDDQGVQIGKNLAAEKEVEYYKEKFGSPENPNKFNPNVVISSRQFKPTYKIDKNGDQTKFEENSPALNLERHFPVKRWDEGSLLNTEETRSLAIVSAKDIVIVEGHGQNEPFEFQKKLKTNVPLIGAFNRMKTRFVFLTPVALAQAIKSDGLTADHILIKLNICYGGGAYPGDTYNMEAPFAKLLAQALGQLNYNSIIVAGFQGMSVRREGGSHVTINKPGGDSLPTRDNRRYFNAQGEELKKGQVKEKLDGIG